MEDQDTVEPEAVVDEVEVNEPVEESVEDSTTEVEQEEVQQVPLHALKKERRKRQEADQELEMLRKQLNARQAEEDEAARYESVTKAELNSARSTLKREIIEETWAAENPEKFEKITEDLPDFLKKRPNLAKAIDASTNRYAEAWELMTAFAPKKTQRETRPKAAAPGSPTSVPKAAAMNEAVDLMSMSDTEFNEWRKQQRRRR